MGQQHRCYVGAGKEVASTARLMQKRGKNVQVKKTPSIVHGGAAIRARASDQRSRQEQCLNVVEKLEEGASAIGGNWVGGQECSERALGRV